MPHYTGIVGDEYCEESLLDQALLRRAQRHDISEHEADPKFVEMIRSWDSILRSTCEETRAGFEPIVFPPMNCAAGGMAILNVQPYRVYGGPYCLEVYGQGTLRIQQFQVGNESLFGIGTLRTESLRANPGAAPAGLRLFSGPPLRPELIIRVHVFSTEATLLEATLWALPFEEARRVRRIARASTETVDEYVEKCKGEVLRAQEEKAKIEEELASACERGRRLEEELAELRQRAYVPTAEDLRRRDYHERCLNDRLLTSQASKPLDEDGGNGQWSTACDES